MKQLIYNKIKKPLRNLYNKYKFIRGGGFYGDLKLTDSEASSDAYKKYLGGGADSWDKRGRFQLEFLKSMGLEPHHRLLDVGCGPIRGGVFFISYLLKGNYFGVEYNGDFVLLANRIINENKLYNKAPKVAHISDFNFKVLGTGGNFDYVIAFSVLNHCNDKQKRAFFFKYTI